MNETDKVLIRGLCLIIIVCFAFGVIFKYRITYAMSIEGKVVSVQYVTHPPFPRTVITFTTLGDNSESVMLSGTTELGIKTGSTYKITYNTPFFYLYAVPSEIRLIS
jgi:hypothetical protein